MRRLALCLLAVAATSAGADDFKLTGNLEIWGYATALDRAQGSPYNPDNRVARMPATQWTLESRLNLRLRDETSEFVLRPRLLQQHDIGRPGDPDTSDAWLNQAFLRQRLTPAWTLVAGRELLSWGPASFRSPSSPLYFDAGRTNPMRDVSGVDLVRLAYTEGRWGATLAHVVGDARLTDDPVRTPMNLAKADYRGEDNQAAVVVADRVQGAVFVGAYALQNIGDAWMLYGEIGHGRRPHGLDLATPGAEPPILSLSPAPARTSALLGANYTLENGQTLLLEALYDGHGLSRDESRRLAARVEALAASWRTPLRTPTAAANLGQLGRALSTSPSLLGRDYLAVQWQSNPQEGNQFWRVGWVGNLTDHSHQLSAYYERNLATRWSVFVSTTINRGGEASEAVRQTIGNVVAGFKFFVM